MKYDVLGEGDSIKVVKGVKRTTPPLAPGKVEESKEILFPTLKTIVFTDGSVDEVDVSEYKHLSGYYTMNDRTYTNVTDVEEKELYLENYSYAVKIIVSKEHLVGRKIGGWFEVIKDIQVYLKNPKDKKAMKEVKMILNIIRKNNIYDYEVLDNLSNKFIFSVFTKNVYTLKKTK